MKRVRFCWKTKRKDIIRRIMDKFRIYGMSVNHESTASVSDEELALLEECERLGYIAIRERFNL